MKFSIRDLLLVTVIVALVMGWWLDRASLALQIEAEKAQRKLEEVFKAESVSK